MESVTRLFEIVCDHIEVQYWQTTGDNADYSGLTGTRCCVSFFDYYNASRQQWRSSRKTCKWRQDNKSLNIHTDNITVKLTHVCCKISCRLYVWKQSEIILRDWSDTKNEVFGVGCLANDWRRHSAATKKPQWRKRGCVLDTQQGRTPLRRNRIKNLNQLYKMRNS